MVAARKKRVPAPNSPKLPNVENLSRAGLKNRSNNITFHATYPPNYSKKVGAVILRIWYSIVRIEKEKSLASCGAFPALESPLLQNLMGKGAAAMPSNRNMTRTNESFIRVTQLPSFQSASPFVSANASIAHTNEALPPTSQVTCFHEDGRGHQGNPSPNSPEIKHKAAVPAPPRVFFPAEVLRKPRKIANPRQKGELLSVVKGFWWTWSGSNRRPLPCHGSALPAAPQAHRKDYPILHGAGPIRQRIKSAGLRASVRRFCRLRSRFRHELATAGRKKASSC